VGGDRMVGSWSDMNQGSRYGKGTAFMTARGSQEPCPKGDRAFVVAKKRGNTVTRHIVSWGLASKYFVVEEGIWSDCFVGYGQISCGS